MNYINIKVANFYEITNNVGYDLTPVKEYQNLYGRLVISYKKTTQQLKRKLENVTGIYILLDRNNGKKYIGSAYGENGIWKRWSDYIYSNNGGNKEMLQLDNDYIRDNFKFTLLERYEIGTELEFIISRENYWKRVMLSRKNDGYGYNDN